MLKKKKDIRQERSPDKLNTGCNKLICLHSYAIDNKISPIISNGSLFCVSPWTKLYLDINNIMKSSCNGYAIDISKDLIIYK